MRKIFSLFAAVLFAFAANAAVINITNETANALQTALNGATTGDEIVMAAGTYEESGNYLAFTGKELTVRAAEGAEVIIKTVCPVRLKEGAKAEFINVKFDCSTIGSYEQVIVPADDTDNKRVVLTGCEFYGWDKNYAMIEATSSRRLTSVTIDKCYFHNCKKSVVFIENTGAIELSITNSTFANITTDASGFYAGVIDSRATSGSLLVDHCTFYNVQAMNTDYAAVGKVATPAGASVSNSIFMLPAAQDNVRAIRDVATAKNCFTYNYLKDSGWGIHSSVTKTDCANDKDPKFKDAANGDFTLADDSPALTAGSDGKAIGDPRWAPAAPALLEAPDAAPAAPTWPANQVKAVYSGTYSADCNFGEWGSGTAYTQDTYGKKYVTTNLGYFGLEFKEHLNCSKMEKLHLDIWVAADASMRIVPIWGGAEQGITKNLTGQQWNSVEIALSEFNQVTNWADVYQIKIDNAKNLTFWLNNVYFYTTQAPAVDETAPADVKAVVESASYFSVKIKASATDASDAVKLTVKNGDAEVASINAVSGADAILTVNNLKPNTDYNFSVIASDESGNTAEPVAVAAKTIVAPAADAAPKTYKGLVKSIYSDKYAAAPASIGTLVAGWWEPTELSQGEIAQGDNALFYAPKATGMFGWEFAETDMTGFPYLHISIYPLADGKIKIFPVVNGSTDDYVNIPDVKGGEWNHLVFDFSGKDLTKVFQIGWQDYYTLNGFFVDNVYFSQEKEDVAGADRRINAYGLNVVADGDNYTFSYIANIDGTEANLIFYQDGVEKGTVAIAAPIKGQNQASVAKSDIPNGINTWAVELKAGQVYEFGKLAEGDNLNKCHLAIDNSPESDYFGRMYIANRSGSGTGGIYVYNQDYTIDDNMKNLQAGQPKWQSMGRPSVAENGTVYIGDWGDSHGGVYVLDPATLQATCLFTGTQDAKGVWTNDGVAMGSSTASVGVYGAGANTVLYAMNEDVSSAGTTLYAHGVNVYQLGQENGSILNTWTGAPTKTFALQDNAAEMFVINATSKGAFFSCSRAKPNNAAGARSLQFYNTNGERTYVALPEGETADLTGSLGGGCAVSRDEDELAIVDGDGNILVYAIAWTGDVPALTKVTKYETAFAALGSLCFDYAGNIVVTAGANYNNSTANHLVAYGVPTANNEIIVPAKKALVVAGADQGTAIEDVTVQPVQKFFRDGQIYIIRDGVVYTITGNVVR